MRRFFSRDAAKELGFFVNKQVFRLQNEYTKRDGGTPRSRAALARLRRDLDGGAPAWMLIGGDLFEGWPENLPSPDEDPAALRALKTTLELYALHQQSRSRGVAQNAESARTKRMTFGRACRLIDPDLDHAGGVQRNLSSAEAAPDFEGVVRSVRALIMLMRGAGDGAIVLDYRSLAQDLYQVQFPDAREDVFQRWSMDYYSKSAITQ
ncbi:type I-E CRISPR-associated protein Cse2/CasB [Bifidobacterium avesanii]|uniref:Type I-E CRISPR-associated protein Cse2/CasB n=1 Tax=Bifidobacterium avesanii TaxID=1798157 RepID=A0A7K3TLS1_9BIFI|nr:type I-E CRISPR-associated protein Cse2/CasB [Bifidobacterium avesanii]KAB8287926.1 type I-E CRISPR-associated protein Cse2/CasB [Bifidobacterium avesanii]NEG79213.1 type I-E CRISPR-associated protein Cse2/CasB [Bifidobacterium avesanii]